MYPFVIKAFSRITKSNFLLGEVRWIDEGSSDVPDDEGEHGGPVDAERDPLVVPLPIVNLKLQFLSHDMDNHKFGLLVL